MVTTRPHRGIGWERMRGSPLTGGYIREWNWFWAVPDKNILGNPQPDRATHTGASNSIGVTGYTGVR